MLSHLLKNLHVRQTALLYIAMVFNLVLGYLIVKFNTTYLSLADYGRYSFFLNTVLFARVFFTLGLFEVSSRSLAVSKDRQNSRQLYSSTLLLAIFLGMLFSLSILGLSAFYDSIFEIKIGILLLSFAPFSFILLLQFMLHILLRGLGQITKLSLYTFLPRLFYLLCLIPLVTMGIFTLYNTLMIYFITLIIVVLGFALSIKLSFVNIKKNIYHLFSGVKEFGSHLYIANILSTFFYHSDKILLAYFLDAEQLAFYSLAFALTFPITHFSNALSTTAYKKYANTSRIDRKDITLNLIYIILVAVCFIALRKYIILYLFSEKFAPAIPVFAMLTLAAAMNGLSVPYTTFFKAHKEGVRVKNITFVVQIVYFGLNLILIPLLGIFGAALSALLAFTLDYSLYLYFYRKIFKRPAL
jgi:O-antigen/teichoic acid export membrane protein